MLRGGHREFRFYVICHVGPRCGPARGLYDAFHLGSLRDCLLLNRAVGLTSSILILPQPFVLLHPQDGWLVQLDGSYVLCDL